MKGPIQGGNAISADFEEVYRAHLPLVWQYVRSRVPVHHEAEDVTSEVFARAWRSWPRYDPALGTAGAWLFRIAHHTVVDWWRKHRPGGQLRERPLPADEVTDPKGGPLLAADGNDPESRVLEEELLAGLQRGLLSLAEREREALYLRFSAGLRAAEIGEILGLSEGATKMIIYRAVMKLKEVVARDRQRI